MCIQYYAVHICGLGVNLNLDLCDDWRICLPAKFQTDVPRGDLSYPRGNSIFLGSPIYIPLGPQIVPIFLYSRCGTCNYCLTHDPREEQERWHNTSAEKYVAVRILETRKMLQYLEALVNELEGKMKLVMEEIKAYEVRLGVLERVSAGLGWLLKPVPQGWEWVQNLGAYTGYEGGQRGLADWNNLYAVEKDLVQGNIMGEIKRLREEGWFDDSSKWTVVTENEVDKDLKALGIGVDEEMQPMKDY